MKTIAIVSSAIIAICLMFAAVGWIATFSIWGSNRDTIGVLLVIAFLIAVIGMLISSILALIAIAETLSARRKMGPNAEIPESLGLICFAPVVIFAILMMIFGTCTKMPHQGFF